MDRLFTLDAQFLFDAVVLALSMLVLFTLLSYLLFNPVRDVLEKRKQRVADEQSDAKKAREEALLYKAEYEEKLYNADKEVEMILSQARKKAKKNEQQILAEARQEAARIKEQAHKEIELEKTRAIDDMKQEMISIASDMAKKALADTVSDKLQDELIDRTLREMGEQTWQS